MAYNLYQVQMAKAWAERIEKETAQAEKFWHQQTMKAGNVPAPVPGAYPSSVPPILMTEEALSMAGSAPARSAAPTGYTSKTSYLRSRLEKLEEELSAERESRRKAEEDLQELRKNIKRH
ncbi:hypothetical protein Agub_g14164 [Astrephomene gubernaculifera]|uniref:Uncharacterized protein n=1 Tax=Astrephomene gubernaculifera TaxID=47775 RepID=A0AAD3E1F5_9CHLO|nr:hypothetical protein Agub_g14164 [Astrephomene gubernaculifera]